MEEKYICDLLFSCSNYLLKQVIWKCQNKLYIHGGKQQGCLSYYEQQHVVS